MQTTNESNPLLETLLSAVKPHDSARDDARRHLAALLEAQEQGNTAIEVDAEARTRLREQDWVGEGDAIQSAPTPVVLHNGLLQFHIYWQAEQRITQGLAPRVQNVEVKEALPEAFVAQARAQALDPEKLEQIAASLEQSLVLLTGGPGTGKTTTLAWLLAALLQQEPELTIALAAPTGKAAQRMKEALANSISNLPLGEEQKRHLQSLTPHTLHRLLGIGQTPHPRYASDNPLTFDLVVVDEASMVDVLTLSKLVQALKPGSRLILMGDPNQLASVEAGNVLADLVARFPLAHRKLTRSHRFNKTIGQLADAVLQGDSSKAWGLLQAESQSVVSQLPLNAGQFLQSAETGYAGYLNAVRNFAPGDPQQTALQAKALLSELAKFRVLSPMRRHSRWGVVALNQFMIKRFQQKGLATLANDLYIGQPVLIQENDYHVELFNGDQGVILPLNGLPVAWFEEGDEVRPVPVSQLPSWETAFAMTVHKAQGAEFDGVLLVLPDEETPLLSRELIYTALTRAKKQFILAAGQESFNTGVQNRIKRVSGIGKAK